MARLRTKYRNSVAEVPALEAEAAADPSAAAASTLPHDDSASAALMTQLAAMRGADSAIDADRLEAMRERIDNPPPAATAVDDVIEAAKEHGACG